MKFECDVAVVVEENISKKITVADCSVMLTTFCNEGTKWVCQVYCFYISCCILLKLPSLVDVIEAIAGAVVAQNASVLYK